MPKPKNDPRSLLKPHFAALATQAQLAQSVYSAHAALVGKNKPFGLRVDYLTPLFSSILSTSHAIAVLVGAGHVNESYMLIRALHERCLNYCYLIISPDEEFDRWFEHSMQKGYRELRKELVVADFGFKLEFSGYDTIWNRPEVVELMSKFATAVSGKEKRDWSTLAPSRVDRIEWLSKSKHDIFWEPFVLVEALFYAEASEALHGTFYGTVFHRGFFEPRFQQGDKASNSHDASSLILATVTILLNTVMKAANLRHSMPSLLQQSIKVTQSAAKLLKSEIRCIDTTEIDPSKKILKTGRTKKYLKHRPE